MPTRPSFPFSALVGQERLKKGLLLNAINPRIGGILIRGEKGTAKSTAVRAFAQLLPAVAVVSDCPYHCDPRGPLQCVDCARRQSDGDALPVRRRSVPLVDLPIGATEDRLVGTLNLEQAIKEGERVFEPGLLAAANRGILYVDEVNLLGDHLVDVLLDAASMGQNYVEREGISVIHPAEFILIGTMNPEEGDLRPQLLDRFALAVTVAGLSDPTERAEVVRRRIAFEADPAGFLTRWEVIQEQERERIEQARALLPTVRVEDQQIELISRICADFAVDGLRGDIVMYKTAVTLAAYDGRRQVIAADIQEAADLALPHRRRRQPFDDPDSGQQLQELVKGHLEIPAGDHPPASDSAETADPTPDTPPAAREGSRDESQTFATGQTFPVRPLGPDRASSRGIAPPGRRTLALGQERSGHVVRARIPMRRLAALGDVAPGATLRAAAPYQRLRRETRPNGPRLLIAPSDLRERVRESKVGNLILFVVDASGSMAARQRMAAVKGAILSLLVDAYQKRDRVALIAFRGSVATLLLPPTNSVELARRRLHSLPTGGRTPLAHALALGRETIQRHLTGHPHDVPWLILVSDGRPNVPLGGDDAMKDACVNAARLREHGVRALVIDSETGPVRLGQNRRLAEALGGRYLRLEELAAGGVDAAARQHLGRNRAAWVPGRGGKRWTR